MCIKIVSSLLFLGLLIDLCMFYEQEEPARNIQNSRFPGEVLQKGMKWHIFFYFMPVCRH